MKPILKKMLVFLALGICAACLFCASCVEPTPLYGTWSDNVGNTFSFFQNGTFSSKVSGAGQLTATYEGNYSVKLNALTLTCTNVDLQVVTEWDIRGNMLYLDWTSEDGERRAMTLYKISG